MVLETAITIKMTLVAVVLLVVGLVIILAVPDKYEGPLLLCINEEHSIRLADAVGLILAVPAWLYLCWVGLRWWSWKGK